MEPENKSQKNSRKLNTKSKHNLSNYTGQISQEELDDMELEEEYN